MLRFSKATQIALHAVHELALCPGERLSTQELATRLSMTPHHLAKVLQQLSRAGVIQSNRGPGGGHSLARHPKNVTLMDVIEVIERRRSEGSEAWPAESEDRAGAALGAVFQELDEQLAFTLRSISFKTLLAMGKAQTS